MAVLNQISFCVLFLLVTFIPFSSCQSSSTNSQNIETAYPFATVRPPVQNPSPPNEGSSLTPPPIPESDTVSGKKSDNNVVKAVAATTATTFVVATLAFFLGRKIMAMRRSRVEGAGGYGGRTSDLGNVSPPMLHNEKFTRVDGNVKGLIVDENGLDVLYWRKLESENQSNHLHRDVFVHNLQEEQDEDEEESADWNQQRRRKFAPIQERPFLRGQSSCSHVKVMQEISSLNRVGDDGESAGYVQHNLMAVETKPQPPTTPVTHENKQGPAPPPPPPPPPLPAVTGKKISAPPPPPKPAGVAMPSVPALIRRGSEEEQSSTESSQVKLKPLHWDKVNKNTNQSMVWDKIHGGSFRFDNDLMEALFGTVATNRKSPGSDRSDNVLNNNSKSPRQIFILGSRKSQNTAIVIKSLAISRRELLDALHDGHGLDAETLEKLNRIVPTKEEEANILAFSGDPIKLADAESFLFHLLRAVPSAFARTNAMFFRSNYYSETLHFKECLQTLELACKELRTRGLLSKLLEAVLKAGNRMNAGTSRGNAQAFKLTSLQKLSDVKSTDGKTTLLHFVAEEVVRSEGKRCLINQNRSMSRTSSRGSSASSISSVGSPLKEEREMQYIKLGLPIIGGLSSEFTNVKKAAQIDYTVFDNTCTDLAARAKQVKRLIASECSDSKSEEENFLKEMSTFLDTVQVELNELRDEQTRIKEIVKRTTNYYQPGASDHQEKTDQLQVFVIIRDFLNAVDQACVEITRNQQKRRNSPNYGRSGW